MLQHAYSQVRYFYAQQHGEEQTNPAAWELQTLLQGRGLRPGHAIDEPLSRWPACVGLEVGYLVTEEGAANLIWEAALFVLCGIKLRWMLYESYTARMDTF